MAWPPYVAVTLNVVPDVPDPSSTQTVANATVFSPPAATLMGALSDDEPNAAVTVFELLSVTAASRLTVNVALWVPFSVAVMLAVACVATTALVTVKDAVAAPAATVTELGTVAAGRVVLVSHRRFRRPVRQRSALQWR